MQFAPRYTLQPWAGKSTRHPCPSCQQPDCFTRYLDTHTNELLPEAYGRCNHEVSCGYQLNPYHPGPNGQSYANEVRQGQSGYAATWTHRQPAAPRLPQLGVIPEDVVQQSMTHYRHNNFVRMLEHLFGGGEADELVRRFEIGTSGYWSNSTVFWQRDEMGIMRGGQVVLFDEDGHTAKEQMPDGSKRRCTNWVHKALERRHQKQGKPLPAWLREYLRPEVAKSPTLYGLSQLKDAPVNQPVALTEAAKTAILATPYQPVFIWMAVGSLTNLTAERLRPVKNRRIVLYPDASTNGRAYQLWATKAAELRKQGFDVQVSDFLETTTTEEQKAAGFDLADLILSNHAAYPPSWDLL